MKATAILMQENEIVERGLQVLDEIATRVATNQAVHIPFLCQLLDFFLVMDRTHQVKEELVLFPVLTNAAVEGADLTTAVAREHHLCRTLLDTMIETLSDLDSAMSARTQFVAAAISFSILLGNLIEKEDQLLFRLADEVLDRDQDSQMTESFEAAEREAALPGQSQRSMRWLRALPTNYFSPGAALPA